MTFSSIPCRTCHSSCHQQGICTPLQTCSHSPPEVWDNPHSFLPTYLLANPPTNQPELSMYGAICIWVTRWTDMALPPEERRTRMNSAFSLTFLFLLFLYAVGYIRRLRSRV
ncbi:hypothetical protein PAXRUDRAFT_428263 [Paxillus rubicundulus Ve08.2h10]|uniref:Uncharacterized protein n=1 Tax=Paxillus rubicundulus Ve08.2h10 TaxID=930991 RepID=A0A0D0E893_9AGAM|nr:hypothetical protein PAXRUDRAFT_428263 [Paxillus rubicundulus Ve08.2h10]